MTCFIKNRDSTTAEPKIFVTFLSIHHKNRILVEIDEDGFFDVTRLANGNFRTQGCLGIPVYPSDDFRKFAGVVANDIYYGFNQLIGLAICLEMEGRRISKMNYTAITEAALNHYGYESQLIKAIEELAELQVQLAKCHYQVTNTDTFDLADLCAKIADVEIMLAQVKLMEVVKDGEVCKVSNLVKMAKEHKLKRLAKRVGYDG